MREKAAFLLPI